MGNYFVPLETTGAGSNGRKNNNVPVGKIVDAVITLPNENHFYSMSNQSIPGVAKPRKYCILLDDGIHNIDDLDNVCNYQYWIFQ